MFIEKLANRLYVNAIARFISEADTLRMARNFLQFVRVMRLYR